MSTKLSLRGYKEAKSSRKQSPLPKKEYIALELPVHLYVIALRTGRMTIDHWAHLMVHTAMLMQLSAAEEDDAVLDAARRANSILNIVMLDYSESGVWAIEDRLHEELSALLVELGLYYQGKARAEIKDARTTGAASLVKVFSQFGAIWE